MIASPSMAHKMSVTRSSNRRCPLFCKLCFIYLSFLVVNTLVAWRMERHNVEEKDAAWKIENGNTALIDDKPWKGELLTPSDAKRYSSLALARYDADAEIDPGIEEERCKRYGYNYDSRKIRRRVFWGSLIADDSWQTIHAHAAEAYGIYHTAAFVESNTTQTLTRRELRFGPKSQNLKRLIETNLFGPDTKVTVDYYFDGKDPPTKLHREHLQRQSILKRWRDNGMRPEDIGILSDADEVFTRDFLRALQICNVPNFQPGQDCKEPKVVANTLTFESSPECVVTSKTWHHPDAILGECIDLIGDEKLYKPPLRTWKGHHSYRAKGHGQLDPNDYSKYFAKHGITTDSNNRTMYPLWNGADFRRIPGGSQPKGLKDSTQQQTAFRMHNFFETIDEVRNKYLTYGHPVMFAQVKPLGSISKDLNLTLNCVKNVTNEGVLEGGFSSLRGPTPVFFQDKEYREKRHEQLRDMLRDDEKKLTKISKPQKALSNTF